MASRDDVERCAQANRDVRALALRDLRAFFAVLSSDSVDARDALERFVPLLVQQYGEIAATVAADFFDELREAAPVRESFRAVMADPVPVEQAEASTRWAVAPLFADVPDRLATFGRLAQVVDRLSLQPGRDTIARSVVRDPANARWARVPVGKTCAFCLVLASRGAVYVSEESAGGHRKFHGDCDCTPTPVWSDEDLPEGYDPDALYEQYLDASESANSSRIQPVAAKLREQQGIN